MNIIAERLFCVSQVASLVSEHCKLLSACSGQCAHAPVTSWLAALRARQVRPRCRRPEEVALFTSTHGRLHDVDFLRCHSPIRFDLHAPFIRSFDPVASVDLISGQEREHVNHVQSVGSLVRNRRATNLRPARHAARLLPARPRTRPATQHRIASRHRAAQLRRLRAEGWSNLF